MSTTLVQAKAQAPTAPVRAAPPKQAPIEIGRTDDPAEHEADRIATGLLRTPDPVDLQRSPATGANGTAPPIVHEVLRTPGQPLDAASRGYFEPRLGTNLSQVRIHDDPQAGRSANAVGAHAYTVGDHIAFGHDHRTRAAPSRDRLLAHELVHVAQQRSSSPAFTSPSRTRRGAGDRGLLQRAPRGEERAEAVTNPYPEEAEVIRYAVGARDLGKLADGTVLYTAKYWSATGISTTAFAVGPFTSDMGDIFYVYRIKSADETKGTHTLSRGSHVGGWGHGGLTPELKKDLATVQGGTTIEVASSGLIPPSGGATPTPKPQQAPGPATQGTPGGTPAQVPAPAEAAPDELTPHRKKWLTAGRDGMNREIGSLFNSIQKLKAARLDVWDKNAKIKDPKPLKDALEAAVEVVGYGMGGVVGGVLTKALAHGLAAEFVKESALKGTAKLTEFIFAHAVEPAEELMNAATKKALQEKGTSANSALVSKGDLLDCYVEAVRLQTINEEKAANEEFNAKGNATFSDLALADAIAVFDALYAKLASEPAYFMRELTVGVVRLKDDMYVEERAKKYGGSVERTLKEDPEIHETDYRSGNVLLLPSEFQWVLGHYYQPPDVGFAAFYGHATGVNTATLMELGGAKVKDLPITLTFRFWAFDPFRNVVERALGLPGDLCKVWFERRWNGDVWVDFDESGIGDNVSDGIEWLASSYMHSAGIAADHDLSDAERHKYAPLGARRVYELIKDKPVLGVGNADIF